MLKKRLVTEKFKQYSQFFPAITIIGGRQVGKTTLLHEIFGSGFDYVVCSEVGSPYKRKFGEREVTFTSIYGLSNLVT